MLWRHFAWWQGVCYRRIHCRTSMTFSFSFFVSKFSFFAQQLARDMSKWKAEDRKEAVLKCYARWWGAELLKPKHFLEKYWKDEVCCWKKKKNHQVIINQFRRNFLVVVIWACSLLVVSLVPRTLSLPPSIECTLQELKLPPFGMAVSWR